MRSLKDAFFLIIGLFIITGSFCLFLQKPASPHYQSNLETPTLKIGEAAIFVEIADSPEERMLGLSGREYLAKDHGLFFIFEEPGQHGFWMKDMSFAIDIVWIDESWHIVSLDRGVGPETFPQIFYPSEAVKYVLELPAGEIDENRIDIGQIVYFDT